MSKNKTKSTEWSIIICVIILITIGLFALYSASKSSDLEELRKQVVWIFVSIPFFIIAVRMDYNFLAKISIGLYLAFNVLLVAVLLTSSVNGASSWFAIGGASLQPSEFAKIAVILFLAYIMSRISDYDIDKPLNLLKIIAIGMIPIVLIVLQPDYGTAFAFIFIMTAMLFVSGVNRKYIIVAIVLAVILVPVLYMFVLPAHAKARIDVYLNPETDPRGAGYNIIQSKLAIGARQISRIRMGTGNANPTGISIS